MNSQQENLATRPCLLSTFGEHDNWVGATVDEEDAYICECGWYLKVSEWPDVESLTLAQQARVGERVYG